MKNKEKELMLIGEAAKFLHVCIKTLRNWHKSGRLVPKIHPLTNVRMYEMKDLVKLLEEAK